MKKRLIVGIIIILLTSLLLGCGKNIPALDTAKYEIYSNQAVGGLYIYTNSYEVIDGVLYLDNYWAYESGSIFNPTYKQHTSLIAFTNWKLSHRR